MGPHRRQFVIGPSPVLIDKDWTSLPIGQGKHLSYHRALPVEEVRDRDGASWHLLGIAVQADPRKAAPAGEIAAARSADVESLTPTWAGRWVLVGDSTLRHDAAGLFGCFYARNLPEGELIVSSSAAILHDHVDAGHASPPLRYRVGMGWYPPPASRFAAIRRLLPSQTLAYGDKHNPGRHRPLMVHRIEAAYDETLACIETSLRTVLHNLAATGRPLWLALTGGYDTRVLLAAMWREKLEFTTFTWETSVISSADRILPPLLARDAGVPHRYIERQGFDEERLRRLDLHTAWHTADLDRELIPWGQYADIPVDAFVILGNVIPLGALHFHQRLRGHPNAVVQSIEDGYGFAEHHADSPAHLDGIRDWAEWIEAHPEPEMDWRDRFYWEQLVAGWCSACEQANDFVEVDCMNPVSCESVLAAMLRIDPGKRYNKRWQVDITYRMAPFLTDHPYHLGGPLVNRLRRGASSCISHPSKRRFVTGRVRSFADRVRVAAPVG